MDSVVIVLRVLFQSKGYLSFRTAREAVARVVRSPEVRKIEIIYLRDLMLGWYR